MNASDYIRDIRIRTDDDPVGIDPYHSDSALLQFINNARRKIAIELECYEKTAYIIPELYIDEYELPADFIGFNYAIDVYYQVEIMPENKPNTESTKTFITGRPLYENRFYINDTRGLFTLANLPEISSAVEPTYTIATFNRSGKTITVDGTSGSDIDDIAKWDKVKGVIKIVSADGSKTEYARVTKIIESSSDVYTLYISSWDMTELYNVDLVEINTLTLTDTSATVTGINGKNAFLTQLTVGDAVTYNGTSIGNVESITNDYTFVLDSAFSGTTTTNATLKFNNKPVFADGDTLQFCSYAIYYSAIPKVITNIYLEDALSLEAQDLVPILASYEAWMRRSRPDMANRELQEYMQKLADIASVQNSNKSHIYNKSIVNGYR